MYRDRSVEEFLHRAAQHIEILNHALRNVPPDRVRMHVCWGNYEGPHHHDVPLEALLPIVLEARAQGLLIEGANPRHAHEWSVFGSQRLPDDKIVIPGVLSTTTNYIEHPLLVAERICRYADQVGRERVMAGTDCGFGTFAGFGPVDPDVAWLKLRSMVEGAQIASERLWGKH
jgi:5-methyltetrahydropteroyltriglutamate--homocysteine methyltransferase